MTRQIRLSKTSRYAGTSLYQLRDVNGLPTSSFTFGVWRRVEIPDSVNDSVHIITESEIGRLDNVAFKYYGDSLLWWVIADANSINDPFTDMIAGSEIRIPDIKTVKSALSEATTR